MKKFFTLISMALVAMSIMLLMLMPMRCLLLSSQLPMWMVLIPLVL